MIVSQVGYLVIPNVNETQYAYAAADFAICRSGAMTCADRGRAAIPLIVICQCAAPRRVVPP